VPKRDVQPERDVQPNSPPVPSREELFREWSVGQLADRSGLSVSALHFYERKGLISSTRNEGNQRKFSREMLRRLAFIRASQSLGIPLTEIGEALSTLPQQRTPNEADWAVLAEGWREVLDARMGLLERLRDDLTSCIGCTATHAGHDSTKASLSSSVAAFEFCEAYETLTTKAFRLLRWP
jgi:MerR family redox-sensitive transcriptional activator SoxR